VKQDVNTDRNNYTECGIKKLETGELKVPGKHTVTRTVIKGPVTLPLNIPTANMKIPFYNKHHRTIRAGWVT